MDGSPSKRRVLGPLHVNTNSPAAGPRLPASKLETTKTWTPPNLGCLKRSLDQENVPLSPQLAKKPRVLSERAHIQILAIKANKMIPDKSPDRAQRECSGSPTEPAESSPIFDTSVIDTSQDTTITEPDAEISAPPLPAPPPPRRQSAMTREEARQKAEILRLRLGLASYKVRTGQADVPLERLKLKPLPGLASQERHPRSPQLPRLPSPPPPSSSSPPSPRRRTGEPGLQRRKALPAGPLRRSNSSSSSSSSSSSNSFSQARDQLALSPKEPRIKSRSLPPSLDASVRRLRDGDMMR